MTHSIQKRVFISALEASAEIHCANLIRAVNERLGEYPENWPGSTENTPVKTDSQIDWVGFGGPAMEETGCTLIANTVSRAAMIYNVLTQLGYYNTLRKNAEVYLDEHSVDLVIVCDSPAFNFHIAKAARKRSIPVLFYVAPQLWAWAPWRIRKLRRCCTRLACILPFEKDWFTRRGIQTDFVGNPLFDEMTYQPDECYKQYADFHTDSPKIALLPGSRKAEIKNLWPVMQQVAQGLSAQHKKAVFFVSAPDTRRLEELKAAQTHPLPIEYTISDVFGTSRRCDLALVASGSATLQVAAAGCPMMILYQSSRLLWSLVGWWLIRTPYLSLVNILAGKELVPEFMPCLPPVKVIQDTCHSMLLNKLNLIRTSGALVELTRPLANGRASQNTAAIALDMLKIKTNE